MTLTQTVEISASRRLVIDVPPEIPEGFAVLTLAPAGGKRPSLRGGGGAEGDAPYLRLLGCHKGISGGSVDDFLVRCREDKERELAAEERQFRERANYAKIPS